MTTVTLVACTGKDNPDELYAARLLCFTKNTRMNMNQRLDQAMCKKDILKEIAYMATTIPSSWEFVDCTFLISNVSRATAQQITRTRNASFAMQSQRVSNMSDAGYSTRAGEYQEPFENAMEEAIHNYDKLVNKGMPLEEARDILPIGIHCNLVAKYNLRTLVDMCRKRDSLRVQGEYQAVIQQIKALTIEQWPWAEAFFIPKQQASIRMIEEVAIELRKLEGLYGAVYDGLSGKLAKASDLLKVD